MSAARRGQEFAQRAALYRQWDRALCNSTRFYAAAALINAAFAELLATPARYLLSAPTLEFLGSLSQALLSFNATLAGSLARGQVRGLQVDASIVSMEQGIVQRHLAELNRRERRVHTRLIFEANGLLSMVHALTSASAFLPNTILLGRVLRQLQSSRGRLVNFADCSDREAIGNALIVSARQDAGEAIL
jgi:hypothetical protein